MTGMTYTERMDQYILGNNIIDGQKKVAVFLTVIGGETCETVIQSLPDLVNILKTHLNHTPIVIAERHKFYERCQKEDENLSEYISSLQKLTEHCNFNNFLDEAVRDKYVCAYEVKQFAEDC